MFLQLYNQQQSEEMKTQNYRKHMIIIFIIVSLLPLIQTLTCHQQYCTECKFDNFCTLCNQGFTLNNRQKCQKITQLQKESIIHCAKYDHSDNCLSCQQGYRLIDSQCQISNIRLTQASCPTGCSSCSGSVCTQCSVNYQMFNGSCILCNIAHCSSCSSINICATCSDYFQLSNGTCIAQTCQVGYQSSSSNGLCLPCSPGCSSCTNGICSACLSSFFLFNGICNACPSFCIQCSCSTACKTSAKSGLTVFNTNIGISYIKCYQGCKTCSSINWNQCLIPFQGYFVQNGSINKCITNCVTCSTSTTCVDCKTNSFKVSLPDGSDSCLGCSSNCKTCTSKDLLNECVSCFEGFSLVNKTCSQSCSLNCKTCVSAQVCDSCPFNFLLKNGKCLPCILGCKTCSGSISNCVQCVAGTYLKPATKTCEQCQQFCEKCNEKGCISCFNGFFLNDQFGCSTTCNLPCATCSSANPNLCLSCILGYNFNPAVPSGCEPVSVFSNTTKACPIGKGRNSASVCVSCTPSNCLYCDGSAPSVCLSCIDGYFKSGNVCAKCSESCRQCNSQQNCFSCAQGFLPSLFDQTQAFVHCLPCKFPCKTCGSQINQCLSCQDGYSMSKGKCESNFGYSFSLVLQCTLVNFEAQLQAFKSKIQSATGFVNGLSITKASQVITTRRLLQGTTGVRVEGTLSTFSTSINPQERANLDSSFAVGSSFGGIPIVSFSSAVLTQSQNNNSTPSKQNILLGLCVAFGVVCTFMINIVVIIMIIAFMVNRSQLSATQITSCQSLKQLPQTLNNIDNKLKPENIQDPKQELNI